MKTPTLLRLLTFCGLAVVAGAADTAPARQPAGGPAEGIGAGPVAPRGRLIVGYRDSVAVALEWWSAQGKAAPIPITGGLGSLDGLHRRFGVSGITPLFRPAADDSALAAGGPATVPTTAVLRAREGRRLLAARARRGGERALPAAGLPDLHHVYLLAIPTSVDPERAAAAFRRDPHVAFAQPDYAVALDLVPDDPYFHSSGAWKQTYPDLWALRPDKLDMRPAWDRSQGRGVVVAVVDSGVDNKHPDLAANLWKNPGEIAGNHLDDDDNGFVDDVGGWSFVTCRELLTLDRCKTPSVPGPSPEDDNGHGTHVAGTIAAIGNNGRGIVGVAPQATILPVKAFNVQGVGLTSEISAALLYAATNGADVINNSWGCGFCPVNPTLEAALQAVHGLGVVAVFAAGNSATDVRYRSPHNQRHPKPLVVAATNQDDEPTWFSGFGAAVDVAAPGGGRHSLDQNILSLRAAQCALCEPKEARRLLHGGEYLRLQGTSMATPHVSGLAALLLAQRPGLTPEQVRQLIRSSAADVAEPGYDLRAGAGRIDAAKAVAAGSPLEAKISSPGAHTVAGSDPLVITGTAAGADFASYQLLYREEVGSDWHPITAPVTREVRDGELGRWDLAGLPLGWKALRLQATRKDGRSFDDVLYVGRQLATRRLRGGARDTARSPQISGSLVVFEADVDQQAISSRLFVHDLASGKTRRLSAERYTEANPQIAGNLIAWKSSGSPPGQGRAAIHACRYDAAANSCPIETIFAPARGEPNAIRHVVVDGDRIAWSGVRIGRTSIVPYLRVYDTVARKVIWEQPAWPIFFDLEGDLLVTAFFHPSQGPRDPGNTDLRLYDLAKGTTVQITRTPEKEWSPKIRGSRILFERHGAGRNQLMLYDLDTRREQVLVDGFPLGALDDGAFDGSRVVWRRVGDIYTLDLASRQIEGLVVSPLAIRTDVKLSGDRLVWMEMTRPALATGVIHAATLGELE